MWKNTQANLERVACNRGGLGCLYGGSFPGGLRPVVSLVLSRDQGSVLLLVSYLQVSAGDQLQPLNVEPISYLPVFTPSAES